MKSRSVYCPIYEMAHFLGKRWTTDILLIMSDSTQVTGFNQLMKGLHGITPKILTERLRLLQENGFIEKQSIKTKIRKITYCITQKGCELRELLQQMKAWNLKWGTALSECRIKTCRTCLCTRLTQ